MTERLTGIGIHSGQPVNVVITKRPAGSTGILLRRTDIAKSGDIALSASSVVSTSRGVVIGSGGVSIGSVEHFAAACGLTGADGLLVEVNGPELPIGDGSVQEFSGALSALGFSAPESHSNLTPDTPVIVDHSSSWARAEPADSFSAIFNGIGPNRDECQVLWREGEPFGQLVSARTFCRLSEIETLWGMGLIRGGGLDRALVYADVPTDRVRMSDIAQRFGGGDIRPNYEGLLGEQKHRIASEWAWHKLLDLIGDVMLLGGLPKAQVSAYGGGHTLHLALLKRWKASAAA